MNRIVKAFIPMLFILLCGDQAALADCSAAALHGIEGIYFMKGKGASATLEIKADQGRYVVLLSGGGSPETGAASSADCEIRATGELNGNSLIANFTEIETDTFSYSRSEAEKENRKVKIVLSSTRADVVNADTLGYCGLGTEFTGAYSRKMDR